MLQRHAEKPGELEGVVEVSAGLRRHVGEHVRHPGKLAGTPRRRGGRDEGVWVRDRAALGRLAHDALIPANVVDDGAHAQGARPEEVIFGRGVAALLHLGEKGPEPAVEHLSDVRDDVPLPLVRLRHGEDPVLLGGPHLVRPVSHVPVVERATRPEGVEHLSIGPLVLLGHVERVLGTHGKLVELVEDPVRGHLGRDHAGARLFRPVAREQVVPVDDDPVTLEHAPERQRSAHDHRLALGLEVALPIEERPLERYSARAGEEGVLYALRAGREHDSSEFRT